MMHNKTKKEKIGLFLFLFTGIVSTIWFLIRVIPKPSRATYPCMRATAPFMSGLVIYLMGISGAFFGFKKVKEYYRKSSFKMAAVFSVLVVVSAIMVMFANNPKAKAFKIKSTVALDAPNTPEGTPKGYWPGRVAWVMDKNATSDYSGDAWYNYTNKDVVRKMLADGIRRYADTTDLGTAWQCLFKYFNMVHGKGWKEYDKAEKIVIKLNHTNLGQGHTFIDNQMSNAPEMVFALLEELIDSVGIPQGQITIGDPYRGFPDETFDMCHGKYPNVHYIEGSATDGREQTTLTSDTVFFTSNSGEHVFNSRLPQAYMDADYMINMACLKSHESNGITLCAKNHQGSVIAGSQTPSTQYMIDYMHFDYPDVDTNQHLKLYRHIVDYMAHSKLGGNTLVYILDGLWAGRGWEGFIEKFGMAPFNNDYPNSMFISQDAVAIESVGFDFLYNEYNNYPGNHDNGDYPLMPAVEDYIKQAADPKNWPTGVKYDPDHSNHSTPVKSLGVHEHWNSVANKQYSVNLTGKLSGIELVSVPASLVSSVPLQYTHINGPTGINNIVRQPSFILSPNPASNYVTISYTLNQTSKVIADLYTLNGKKVATLLNSTENAGSKSTQVALDVPAGVYICKLNTGANVSSTKLIVR